MTSDTRTPEILECSVEALKAHWLMRKRRLASLKHTSSPELADRLTEYSSSTFPWICIWIVHLFALHMFQVSPHFLPVPLSLMCFQLHTVHVCIFIYNSGPGGIRVSHDLAEDVTFPRLCSSDLGFVPLISSLWAQEGDINQKDVGAEVPFMSWDRG